MRRKKHKHTRRAVSFYKLSYGFHEPYKVYWTSCIASLIKKMNKGFTLHWLLMQVLLDGNFVHAAITSK